MKFLPTAALLFLFTLSLGTCISCSASPIKHMSATRIDYDTPHQTTHRIEMDIKPTLGKKGGHGTCSATAIAPHVLLTAAHCVDEPFDTFYIDHNEAEIIDVVIDSNDHALVRVKETFEHWAPLGAPGEQGDDIFFWGNPGGIEDVMRKGYVSKDNALGVEFIQPVTIYSMPVNHGDSGSGVFNLSGEVTAVVSKMYVDGDFVLMGSFDFAFTNDDIKQIGLIDDVKNGIKVQYGYLVAPLAI